MKRLFKVLRKAVRDRAAIRPTIEPLPDSGRIDGKTCLVTGANSGLGKAVAIDLATRGGHVLMACRSGHPDAGEDVNAASGTDRVEMLRVDLSDMRSVHRLCDELRDRGTRIDIAVLNAGLMPRRARRTAQGFEIMFAVHFLANRVLVDRWLKDGTVRPATRIEEAPRIVLVSSDAHRSAEPIDFDRFGEFSGLRRSGRDQALRRQQARHVHVRDRALATPESRRQRAHRRSLALPRPRQHCHRAGSAAATEASRVPVDETLLPAPDQGRGARQLPLLRRRRRPAQRHLPAHADARSARPSIATDRSNGARLWEASEALLHSHAPPDC